MLILVVISYRVSLYHKKKKYGGAAVIGAREQKWVAQHPPPVKLQRRQLIMKILESDEKIQQIFNQFKL